MSSYRPPIEDVLFSLTQLHDFGSHYQALGSDGMDLDQMRLLIEAASQFASRCLNPCYAAGDTQGAQWRDGEVLLPDGFESAYRQYVEAGWPQLGHDEAWGGHPCPYSARLVVNEFFQAANQAWAMVPTLSEGAIKTLASHAGAEQKALFLPKLVSGEWTATMCLTEPQAGSDLGLIRSRATPLGDGLYRINGDKIFISNGDHALTDNIVHLVLARLPEAPPGTRGISLFLVPKRRVLADGSLAERNGVHCTGLEHKMGLRGSATCALRFEDAEGWLVGSPHRGLQGMFLFINKSRLGVAQQAQGQAEAAYQIALRYAKTRLQGRNPCGARRPELAADALIDHADIRRMLLTQQVIAEGGRALVHLCAKWIDVADYGEASQRLAAERRLGLLTPITKGVLSELGCEAIDLGLQVLGGHGYAREWTLEQRLRDVRITRIYEGTTGVQAQDLLARKVLGTEREVLQDFASEILEFTHREPLRADKLRAAVLEWLAVSDELAQRQHEDAELISSVAIDYLMLSGYVCLAYVWALAESAARNQFRGGQAAASFYQGKCDAARFYFARILPRTEMHLAAIRSASVSTKAYETAA